MAFFLTYAFQLMRLKAMNKFLFGFLFLALVNTNVFAQSLAIDFSRDGRTLITENFAGQTKEKKSAGLGVLYSLLLPGMGELYAGDYSLGKYFTIADVALWGALVGTKYYGDIKRDNYIAFAELHAGVNRHGKDDVYWGTIGNYDNINIYNDEMELMREFDKIYDVDTYFWEWDEVANRKKYRSMRNASETAYNNIKFVVSALIINRLASAVDALLLIKRNNKAVDEARMRFGVGVEYVGSRAVGFSFAVRGSF